MAQEIGDPGAPGGATGAGKASQDCRDPDAGRLRAPGDEAGG